MSLVEQYHADHKARLARMGSGPAPKPVIVIDTKLQEENALLKKDVFELRTLVKELQKTVARQRGFIAAITGKTGAPVATIGEIIYVVGERYGLSRAELAGERRDKKVTIPRQLICYLARKSGHSLHSIASQINKDHTSVVHGTAKTEQRLADRSFRTVVDEVQKEVAELATKRAQMASDLIAEGGVPE